MKVTIEIETEKLTNKVLFQVTDECTKQSVNTRDVETILVWEGELIKAVIRVSEEENCHKG